MTFQERIAAVIARFRRKACGVHHRCCVSLDIDQEVSRGRRLEPGEEEKLLKAADAEMKLRIIAALDTGMRKGEMLRVQLKQIKNRPKRPPNR